MLGAWAGVADNHLPTARTCRNDLNAAGVAVLQGLHTSLQAHRLNSDGMPRPLSGNRKGVNPAALSADNSSGVGKRPMKTH